MVTAIELLSGDYATAMVVETTTQYLGLYMEENKLTHDVLQYFLKLIGLSLICI